VKVYLDTTAVLPLFLVDAHTSAMQAWAAAEIRAVMLSDFAAAEFAAAISRGVRISRLSATAATALLTLFDRWRLQTEQRPIGSGDIVACEGLVRDFQLKLSAPDAMHLAIARAESTPLVTLDERLAAASRATGHPAIVPGR
jgi:predicted nucleic acid-binding protein